MKFTLAGVRPPFRFRPESPMSDEELIRFCAANDVARVERDVDGEILVMSPAGSRTGRRNAAIISALDTWPEGTDAGMSSIRAPVSPLPMAHCAVLMPRGLRLADGTL
jgi:Putative restriction endonuclease